MKHLTIIRHAKSSWSSSAGTDFDRPLNGRGERSAPQMAQHLKETVELRPDYVISSPAARAIATARIIAPALGIAVSAIVQNQAVYNASLHSLVYTVSEIPDQYQNAVIFGHMPGVEELVRFLSGAALDHYPTCGVAMLKLDLTAWADAGENCGSLLNFLDPKMLESS